MAEKNVKVKYIGGSPIVLETEFGPPQRLKPGEEFEVCAVVAEHLDPRKHFERVGKPKTSSKQGGKD